MRAPQRHVDVIYCFTLAMLEAIRVARKEHTVLSVRTTCTLAEFHPAGVKNQRRNGRRLVTQPAPTCSSNGQLISRFWRRIGYIDDIEPAHLKDFLQMRDAGYGTVAAAARITYAMAGVLAGRPPSAASPEVRWPRA